MTELLVDIGNSRVKWAHAERGCLGEQLDRKSVV